MGIWTLRMPHSVPARARPAAMCRTLAGTAADSRLAGFITTAGIRACVPVRQFPFDLHPCSLTPPTNLFVGGLLCTILMAVELVHLGWITIRHKKKLLVFIYTTLTLPRENTGSSSLGLLVIRTHKDKKWLAQRRRQCAEHKLEQRQIQG